MQELDERRQAILQQIVDTPLTPLGDAQVIVLAAAYQALCDARQEKEAA